MTRRLAFALAGVPAALALGAVVSHLMLPVLSVPQRALEQPLAVVTSWGAAGATAWIVMAAALVPAAVAYVVVIHEVRARPDDRTLAGALIVAVSAATAACFAFAFVFSSDVYAYAAYGALSATGENPYHVHAMTAATLGAPALTAVVRYEWLSLPACVYGPLFVGLLRGLVVAASFDPTRVLLTLRLLAAAAFLASVALLARLAPRNGSVLAAVVGLNPVVLWSIAEGHYDALPFLAVASAAILSRAKPFLGGVTAGAATLLKATGGLASLFLIYALGERRFTIGALAGIVAAVIVQMGAIASAGGNQPQVASDFVATPAAAVLLGLRGVLAALAAAIALRRHRAGARLPAMACAALAVWLLLPHLYAWYGLWLLPLAALTLEGPEGPALIAATFCGVLRYLPDAVGYPPAAPWLSLLAACIPSAVLASAQPRVARRTRPVEGRLLT